MIIFSTDASISSYAYIQNNKIHSLGLLEGHYLMIGMRDLIILEPVYIAGRWFPSSKRICRYNLLRNSIVAELDGVGEGCGVCVAVAVGWDVALGAGVLTGAAVQAARRKEQGEQEILEFFLSSYCSIRLQSLTALYVVT